MGEENRRDRGRRPGARLMARADTSPPFFFFFFPFSSSSPPSSRSRRRAALAAVAAADRPLPRGRSTKTRSPQGGWYRTVLGAVSVPPALPRGSRAERRPNWRWWRKAGPRRARRRAAGHHHRARSWRERSRSGGNAAPAGRSRHYGSTAAGPGRALACLRRRLRRRRAVVRAADLSRRNAERNRPLRARQALQLMRLPAARAGTPSA